jgi:hypothetical protein
MPYHGNRQILPGLPQLALASSSAPTSGSGAACAAYGRPFTVTWPADGASSPRIIRIVVDLPDPGL